MIDQRQRRFDRIDGGNAGRRPALDQDDLEAEFARGRDLGIGGTATGILGHDNVDAVLVQKVYFAGYVKRTAGQNVAAVGHGERRSDRIDTAHDIAVLRRRRESSGLLPANGQKDPARLLPKCRDRGIDVIHPRPSVAGNGLPCGTTKREKWNTRALGCLRRVSRNLVRKGMGGVNEQIDAFLCQITNQSVGASEAANAGRQGQGLGIGSPSGERYHRGDILALRQPFGQPSRLGRAAQDQDAVLVHG